jgi:hypothetical protein
VAYQLKVQKPLHPVHTHRLEGTSGFVESWAFAAPEGVFAVAQAVAGHVYVVDMDTLDVDPFLPVLRPKAIAYSAQERAFFIADLRGFVYRRSIAGRVEPKADDDVPTFVAATTTIPSEKYIWRLITVDGHPPQLLCLLWSSGIGCRLITLDATLSATFSLSTEPAPVPEWLKVRSAIGSEHRWMFAQSEVPENWLPVDIAVGEDPPTDIAVDNRRHRAYLPLGHQGAVAVWNVQTKPPSEITRTVVDLGGSPANFARAIVDHTTGHLWLSSYNAIVGLDLREDERMAQPFFLKEITDKTDVVNDLDISDDGRTIAAACTFTDSVRVIDVDSGEMETLAVPQPGKVKLIGERIYVLGHSDEQLSLFSA